MRQELSLISKWPKLAIMTDVDEKAYDPTQNEVEAKIISLLLSRRSFLSEVLFYLA